MLPEIKNILYTTDLSENARYAFNYAASVADRYGAAIHVLHVMDSPTLTSDSLVVNILGMEKWEELRRANEKEAVEAIRERLERFCREIQEESPGRDFAIGDILVRIGNPVDEILETVEQTDCDLVVMGAHGLGFWANAMLGSTSRRVLRRCAKPVMVIRLPEDERKD